MNGRVLVTGGAGYVGAVLTPKLLAAGYDVRVLDLCLYGEEALREVAGHPKFELARGDLRDQAFLKTALRDCEAVIHLACISNDPSFDLDPELGRSINYEAFAPLVEIAKDTGVRRFIYASSSSVYGVKEEEWVTEDLSLEPLTDYSTCKAMCEDVLRPHDSPEFVTVTVRPATVCGYSPRLRLDLIVNILTNHAINRGTITVFGGEQKRPNLHIEDMTDLYVELLKQPDDRVRGKVWNVGCENYRVREIAALVRETVGESPATGKPVDIVTTETDDLRSYHVSSEKIRQDLEFAPKLDVSDAVHDLAQAFANGSVPNPMTDDRYYNIRLMQRTKLA